MLRPFRGSASPHQKHLTSLVLLTSPLSADARKILTTTNAAVDAEIADDAGYLPLCSLVVLFLLLHAPLVLKVLLVTLPAKPR